MTRAQLLTTLAARLNKAGTLDTDTSNRLKAFLDEVHRELLTLPGLQRLRDDTRSFASVANQALYALPWVAKINRIFETTNDRTLGAMTLAEYRAIDPDPSTTTGTADAFVWVGYQAVAKQPSAAAALFVKSSAVGDTTQTCYIEGETSDGYPRAVSVVLTGTTAVNVAAAVTDWVRVTKCYLSAVPAGVVTLHQTSGLGTELARIGIGQTQQRYCVFYLYPTPGSVITYSVDATFEITDLAQDTDEPKLPPDFHDLLVSGAMVREYEKTDDPRLNVSLARHQSRVRDLLYWLHETATSTEARRSGRSRLGAYFPAGT